MRGKVIQQTDFFGVDRITPAYAGKSGWNRRHMGSTEDHPRVCGEKQD